MWVTRVTTTGGGKFPLSAAHLLSGSSRVGGSGSDVRNTLLVFKTSHPRQKEKRKCKEKQKLRGEINTAIKVEEREKLEEKEPE